jgi:hypothetical protein
MRIGRPRRKVVLVSVRATHIALDLRLDGEQISGHADDGKGHPESFSGWMGLIGSLDRLLERAQVREIQHDEREQSL